MTFLLAVAVFLCGAAFHFPEFPQPVPQTLAFASAANTRQFRISEQRQFHLDTTYRMAHVGVPPNQHTLGHVNCPACESMRRGTMRTQIEPQLLFSTAAAQWLQSRQLQTSNVRARYIAPETIKNYATYINALSKTVFGQLRLSEIHVGHLRAYQELRTEKANPNKVNQELSILLMILRQAGTWTAEMQAAYEPLQQVESDIPRALSVEETARWLNVASSRERWQVIYWYSMLALRTSLSHVEMRVLRMGDVATQGRVSVQSMYAKNRYRIRTIPLTPDAKWAVEQLIIRAQGMGAREPQHYLFPFREKRDVYDVTHGMTTSCIRKKWDEVRGETGLTWFRPHDCRHTAITRWAEAGVPIPVVMSMAGHISQRMMQHYTHISDASKLMAVTAAYDQAMYAEKKNPGREILDFAQRFRSGNA